MGTILRARYSAAAGFPSAALTAGITFSAISSMDRFDRAGSAQSTAAIEQRAEVADLLTQRQNAVDHPVDAAANDQIVENVIRA